jgi:hypothetical protein
VISRFSGRAPAESIGKLNKGQRRPRGLQAARLGEFGGEPMPMTPAEFGKLSAGETEKWAKVVRGANIKPD